MKYTFKSLDSFCLKAIKILDFVKVQIDDVSQGDLDSIEFVCSDKDMKKLIIDVTENSIEIDAHKFAVLHELEIKVSASNVQKLSLSGSVVLDCKKTSKNCRTTFAGSIKASFDLPTTQSLVLTSAGSFKLDLNVADIENFEFCSAGSSYATLQGNVHQAVFKTSGATKIQAENFLCKSIDISSSGASKYEVHAVDTLSIDISGTGKLIFFGTPEVKQCKVGGVISVQCNGQA